MAVVARAGSASSSSDTAGWTLVWADEFSDIGRVMNSVRLAGTVDIAQRRVPFHQPHCMLLNLAVSGTNGSDPLRTAFPARLEVDYVRGYLRKQQIGDC